MAEYIEKQDALDALGVTKNATKYGGDHSGYDTMMLYEIHDVLTGLPSADVAPVRHARWIKYTGMGKEQWMCSECSAEEKNPKVANYCYHCGAKMDGGDEHG